MTYVELLAIIAIVWAIVWSLYSFIHYLHLKSINAAPHKLDIARSDVFWHAFFPFINTFIFWIISILLVVLICGDATVRICARTPVNTNEQVVMFEEQNDAGYIVSVAGKEYICTEIVIDDNTENLQVVFVDYEIADNFVAKFFFYEAVECKDTYELHIPANYLNSN